MVSASEQRKRNIDFLLLQAKHGDLTEKEIIFNVAFERGLTKDKVTQYIEFLIEGGKIERTDEPYPHLKLAPGGA
jgi:hypothetical protein